MGGHQGQTPGEDLLRQGEACGVSSLAGRGHFIPETVLSFPANVIVF